MRRITALSCVLAFACAAPAARAEGVAPVEGKWHATTSAGLPISFEVSSGQLLNARFRFRWGFCGSFESAIKTGVPDRTERPLEIRRPPRPVRGRHLPRIRPGRRHCRRPQSVNRLLKSNHAYRVSQGIYAYAAPLFGDFVRRAYPRQASDR
jgi:hypothetical protein